jgi:hypothetical protein
MMTLKKAFGAEVSTIIISTSSHYKEKHVQNEDLSSQHAI